MTLIYIQIVMRGSKPKKRSRVFFAHRVVVYKETMSETAPGTYVYYIEVRHAFRPTQKPLERHQAITQKEFYPMLRDLIARVGEYGLEGESKIVHNALLKVYRFVTKLYVMDGTEILSQVSDTINEVKYFGVTPSIGTVEIPADMYANLLALQS